jgi:hypothetical protein
MLQTEINREKRERERERERELGGKNHHFVFILTSFPWAKAYNICV